MARAATVSVVSPGTVAADMGGSPSRPRVCLVTLASLRDLASRFVGHGADSGLHLSEDAGIIRVMHTAGGDLGGAKVQGVVIGADGARLGGARGKTPVEGGPAAVVAEITGVVKAAAKAAKVPVGKLAGVGIGSPGGSGPGTRAPVRGGAT